MLQLKKLPQHMKNLRSLHSKVVLVEKLHSCFAWSRLICPENHKVFCKPFHACATQSRRGLFFACVSFFSFLAEWLPGLQRFPLTH